MKLRRSTIFICLGLLTMSLAIYRQAHATLGEGADSVAKDRKALSASQRATTSSASYTVQEVASNATVVREFLTPSGVVFAIAWNGMVHPDLSVLLGSYAAEYKTAKNSFHAGTGQKRTRVKGDRVIVETWGHMRNLQGRAYVPTLVPAGVNLDEIH